MPSQGEHNTSQQIWMAKSIARWRSSIRSLGFKSLIVYHYCFGQQCRCIGLAANESDQASPNASHPHPPSSPSLEVRWIFIPRSNSNSEPCQLALWAPSGVNGLRSGEKKQILGRKDGWGSTRSEQAEKMTDRAAVIGNSFPDTYGGL